jgi:hypothetical protein
MSFNYKTILQYFYLDLKKLGEIGTILPLNKDIRLPCLDYIYNVYRHLKIYNINAINI